MLKWVGEKEWPKQCFVEPVPWWHSDTHTGFVKSPDTFLQPLLSPPQIPHLSNFLVEPILLSQPVLMHFPWTHTPVESGEHGVPSTTLDVKTHEALASAITSKNCYKLVQLFLLYQDNKLFVISGKLPTWLCKCTIYTHRYQNVIVQCMFWDQPYFQYVFFNLTLTWP